MQILSTPQAEQLTGYPLEEFAQSALEELRPLGTSLVIPGTVAGRTIGARILANLLSPDSSVIVHVTGWGIGPFAEDWMLFDGYRRSLGERRPLHEAPVHVFEKGEAENLFTLLNIALLFSWDATALSLDKKWMVCLSHDEWMDVMAIDRALQLEIERHLGEIGWRRLHK